MLARVLTLATFAITVTALAQDAAPPQTMKAVRYHEYGGADKLVYEAAPRPTPGDDEMLVRVFAAGVNPVDAKVREGKFGKTGKLPAIPGYDISGVVESTGKGVTKFKKGDPVFGYLSLQRAGGYAEYAVMKESEAAVKPIALTHEQAASMPVAALTAWQALVDTAKLGKGQSALIHGGSGGVGTFAVQIAHARGAKVYATASEKNLKLLKDLGADEAIDYNNAKFEDVAKDIDVVLDTIGGETQARSFGVMKKGGILVSIVGMPDVQKAGAAGVRATALLVNPDAAELGALAKMTEAGTIKTQVSQVMPLSEARKAHEQIETGHARGKIVLKVMDEPAKK